MIHEFHKFFFDLPLEDYILTFDDGLYSQYLNLGGLLEIDTPKIFFISSGILSSVGDNQNPNVTPCRMAHAKSRVGNYEDYMNLDQILEIQSNNNCFIGGHSHSHVTLQGLSLFESSKYIDRDTAKMCEWGLENSINFGGRFCFPYNDDKSGFYQAIATKYGFSEFYGRGRIDIYDILEN